VFPNKSGEPLRESKLLERVLQPAPERAGLRCVTWHQFRHIHSSLLNDLRVPVKIAQGWLGLACQPKLEQNRDAHLRSLRELRWATFCCIRAKVGGAARI